MPMSPSGTSAASQAPGSLLIVRLSAMGDVIHAMPAVTALRSALPDTRIGWLIEERWSELLCSHPSQYEAPRSPLKPLADTVHLANFSNWKRSWFSHERWREALDCLRDVRRKRYAAVLDLQGAVRSALAARLAGAKLRIGSARAREAPAQFAYTLAVAPHGEHVIEQALSLASHVVGYPLTYTPPAFPCDPVHEDWAERFIAGVGGGPLAILNPGAGWGAKCWPAESFGRVARSLRDRGLQVLINHGPGEEELAEAVRQASGKTAHLLKCSVGELIAIMRHTRLFIGGDTGPMHLAAALGVPVVALFGPTSPERTGPYATRSVVLRNPLSTNNSSHVAQPDEGLLSISADSVIAGAEQLLGGAHG
jgi:heptosyltransferase-1